MIHPIQVKTRLLPLLVVNFIGTVGFSLVLPFLVFLVTDWGGNAFIYGVAGATYSSFQLIGAPVLGRWSDRYGRRRILLLSQVGTLVSWLVFLVAFALPRTELLRFDSAASGAFVLTLPLVVLIAARALDGLTGGNVSVANAYLADVTSEDERAASYGQMAVSSNLGFVLGPAIAGVLGGTALGPLLPVSAAALISLLATLVIAFRLPDVRPCELTDYPQLTTVRKQFGQEQRDCFDIKEASPLTFAWVRSRSGLVTLLATYFLVMLAFNFYYVTFPVFAVRVLGWSITDTGLFFAAMGLLMVAVQGPFYRWVTRQASERALVVIGSLTLALSFWLFDSRTTLVIYLALGLMALGNGVMWPSVLSLLSRAAGSSHQGTVQGFAGSLGAAASIVGLVIGGLLFATLGPKVFWVSAVVAATVGVVGLAGETTETAGTLKRKWLRE